MRIYDISRSISHDTAVWPGDPPPAIRWVARVAQGDPANCSRIHLGPHTATHVDAPHHVFDDGRTVDQLPLDLFVGDAVVHEVTGHDALGLAEVRALADTRTWAPRVLFKTSAQPRGDHEWPDGWPPLLPEAAAWLVDQGALLVGTDAPSVDPLDSEDLPAHRVLLSQGIPILENLRLDQVPPGPYELIALPLKLVGLEASPVRAVLRPR